MSRSQARQKRRRPATLGDQAQRLLGSFLLGRLLRRAAPDTELLAVDQRGADEPALVRGTVDLEHVVVTILPVRASASCSSVFDVHVTRARELDPRVERLDDGGCRGVEADLEVDRGDRGLEQGGEDVPAERDALELGNRHIPRALDEDGAEAELAGHDGAALPRDDVGPDLRQPALGRLRKAVVERSRDGELEDGVAQELEPLVGRSHDRAPRRCA